MQRGWKAHPDGTEINEGGVPAIANNFLSGSPVSLGIEVNKPQP